MGGPLLERTSRKVELTNLGSRLRSGVEGPLRDLRSALAAISVATGNVSGVVRLGYSTPVAGGPLMSRIVEEFVRVYRDCSVQQFDLGFDRDPIASLRNNEIDVLATRLPVDREGLTVDPILSREPRVLLVAKGHPLAGRAAVSWDDVAEYTVHSAPRFPQEAYRDLMPEYSPSGRPIRRGREARTFSEILLGVAQGDVVHPTVPSYADHYRNPGVTAVSLLDETPSRSGLVWSQVVITPAARAFVSCARDIVAGRFEH